MGLRWLDCRQWPTYMFFHDDITDWDVKILGHEVGSNKGQQAFESLATLVAHRLWRPFLQLQRPIVKVRTDNTGALAVVASLKGKGNSMNLIAREFALDAGLCVYTPEIVEHLPGVTNVIADVLSRKKDPRYEKTWTLPQFLSNSRRCIAPVRDYTWWKSLVPPSVATSA